MVEAPMIHHGGIAGNSREPKRIVMPLPAARAVNGVIETIRSLKR